MVVMLAAVDGLGEPSAVSGGVHAGRAQRLRA